MVIPNPREALFNKYTQSERELSGDEQWLYDYFEKIVRDGKLRMEDFDDVYGELVIKGDKESLRLSKSRYGDKEKHQIASVVEWMMFDQIEKSNWLGEETYTYLTSDFDDVRGGADLVIEFPVGENEWRRMAVDVTVSEESAKKKVLSTKEDALEERLSKVKYFESYAEEYKREIRDLPKIVLGMDVEAFKSITTELVRKLRDNKQEEILEIGDLKRQMLEMIVSQSEYFKDVSHNAKVKRVYGEVKDYFKKVLDGIEMSQAKRPRLDNKVWETVEKTIEEEKIKTNPRN